MCDIRNMQYFLTVTVPLLLPLLYRYCTVTVPLLYKPEPGASVGMGARWKPEPRASVGMGTCCACVWASASGAEKAGLDRLLT